MLFKNLFTITDNHSYFFSKNVVLHFFLIRKHLKMSVKQFTLHACNWFILMFKAFNRKHRTVLVTSLTRRCLMELFISKPAISLSMLKKVKNHSCWRQDFYAWGLLKEIVIFIIISFRSITLSHYCINCFNELFVHWVYNEIWLSKSFQSTFAIPY